MRVSGGFTYGAGWSSPVARWAHNPKVAGSNPAPATNLSGIWNFESRRISDCLIGGVAQLAEHRVCNAGVRGSNPLTSTRIWGGLSDLRGFEKSNFRFEI